jgi:integrase
MGGIRRHPCHTGRGRAHTQDKEPGAWSAKYGVKHHLQRMSTFPFGIIAPKRVRIYFRADHYVLQWWDPAAKGNLSDRVDGDLVAAIARARQIEERLTHFRSSGQGCRRLGHPELVDAFLKDQSRRADAGEIAPGSVTRYQSALNHYLLFVQQPEIANNFPYVAGVNRDFQLELAGFLSRRLVSSNGHPTTPLRPMKDPGFVEDAVRAMFAWAADPDRGRLLPDGFRSPFLHRSGQRRTVARDLVGEPDITVSMAVDFLMACDAYGLQLFAPVILYGLRAAEPCFLFGEHVQDGWLRVQCVDGLAYQTKGRRDKRFPLLPCLDPLKQKYPDKGLCFLRRPVTEGAEIAPLAGSSLANLEEEFQERWRKAVKLTAAQKLQLRDAILHEAGGLNYDHIEGEFKRVARQLNWPAAATVKDFRHLFSSLLENAGVPEFYRRYLMGQSPGKAAIVNYTHLNKVKEHYEQAVRREFGPITNAIDKRARELRLH